LLLAAFYWMHPEAEAQDYLRKGRAAAEAEQYDEAIRQYTLAIKSGRLPQTDLAKAYYWRGSAHTKKGDLDEGVADCTRAIELAPKDPEAYYYRGDAYKTKGDLDKALADYTKVIELAPLDPAPYYGRGDVYKMKGDVDRASADYTKAGGLVESWRSGSCP